MLKNNVIEDMKKRGIKWVVVGGIDNVLVKMFDPVFIGLYLKQGYPSASKSVVKSYPEEKVGVFCKKNGRPSIIEYTELSKEMAYDRDENGELKYGESNIIVHIFELETMEFECIEKTEETIKFKTNSVLTESFRINMNGLYEIEPE